MTDEELLLPIEGWETISTIIAPLSSPTFFEKLFMSSARALGFVSAQKACAIGVATKSEGPTLSTSQKRSVTEECRWPWVARVRIVAPFLRPDCTQRL